jgi:hypothetical protein
VDPQRGYDGGYHGRSDVYGLVGSGNRGSEDTPRPECAGQSFHNTERHARAEPNAVVGDDDNAPLDDEHPVRLRDEIERQWDWNEQQRDGGRQFQHRAQKYDGAWQQHIGTGGQRARTGG